MPRMRRHRVGEVGAGQGSACRPVRRIPRLVIQLVSAAVCNGYAAGFAQGKIFTGSTKAVCLPVLNCYSCPGALGACPIGALQNAIGGAWRHIPFYVLGSLMLFGILLGRLVCGFLCPFGLVQDLLHKIPTRKFRVPRRVDRALRLLKYVVLFGMVVGLSLLVTTEAGVTPPFFCEFLCPAGTLGAGIPLLLANEDLRTVAGALFDWKLLVPGGGRARTPAVLPLSVPPRGSVRAVQPVQLLSDGRRRGPLRGVRHVRPRLSHGGRGAC